MTHKDNLTLDIFTDWEPTQVVTRFDDVQVRSSNLATSLSLAVSATLKECVDDRDKIAEKISEWLGEDVGKNILDKYASSSPDHIISIVRALGLIHATGDIRLLQLCAEQFGYSVIEDRFLEFIHIGELAEQKKKISDEINMRRRIANKGFK